ncbi:riboflavin kinase [Gyrodon lividus]|nr:riboflavin kinase [Gyrodon lividus]
MPAPTTSAPPRPAPVQTKSFRASRPNIVGPDTPEDPYPIRLEGIVQHGFGRGSKDLGCPTANLPDESITHMASIARPGVYYGYAQVCLANGQMQMPELRLEDLVVLPMVMSLGWNPFYKNERMTAEIHIMHEFNSDFYGCDMKALVLGYIRPELNYISREALIDDIETDKKVSLSSLARPGYHKYTSDSFFSSRGIETLETTS